MMYCSSSDETNFFSPSGYRNIYTIIVFFQSILMLIGAWQMVELSNWPQLIAVSSVYCQILYTLQMNHICHKHSSGSYFLGTPQWIIQMS